MNDLLGNFLVNVWTWMKYAKKTRGDLWGQLIINKATLVTIHDSRGGHSVIDSVRTDELMWATPLDGRALGSHLVGQWHWARLLAIRQHKSVRRGCCALQMEVNVTTQVWFQEFEVTTYIIKGALFILGSPLLRTLPLNMPIVEKS